MKKDFFDYLLIKMQENKNIYMIFIDLGFPRVDEFIGAYPDRAINTGASEQTALDIAEAQRPDKSETRLIRLLREWTQRAQEARSGNIK